MDSPVEIRVPREIVNDDVVTIADWQVTTGDRVEPKDTVVLVETSKAVVEIEAETEGYVEILCCEGTEVPVGEVIGLIRVQPPDGKSTKKTDSSREEQTDRPRQAAGNGGDTETRFSKKAWEAFREYDLDPGIFKGKGLVREIDVLDYLERRSKEPRDTDSGTVESEAEEWHVEDRLVQISTRSKRYGKSLWDDASISARERGRGIPWLAFNYLWRTWFLGNLVRWAPRFFILSLHRWRGVKVGNGCFIDTTAIIETAHPENISIGDDVRIAAHVVIMTHIKPPHLLREANIMPSVVKSVVLEDHCFIGVNAVIMPGVTVGKAAVVGSGAVVVNNVPPFTLVAGNPAKVVKNFPVPEGEI